MSNRDFPECTIPGGKTGTRAMKITCGECGTHGHFLHINNGIRKPPIAAVQHFQREGWLVGSSHRKDRCPKHAHVKKEKPVMTGVIPLKTDAVLKADPPREMSRADRRIITEKLDEVYGADCYKVPWTDAGVAKDLGVPRQWVVDVRDAMFGPEGGNPLLDEFQARLDKVAPDVVALGDKAKNLFDQIYLLRQQADDITKEMGDLKRIGGRIEKELGR